MHRRDAKRVAAALTGAFVLAGMLLAVLAYVNVDSGLVSGTGSDALGWIVPIVAGAAIGAVAFLLLDEGQPSSDDAETLRPSVCAACGSEIIAEWRICPHCGAMLECDVRVAAGSCGSGKTA